MTDERQQDEESEQENNLQLSASLREFKFTAGGGWRQYLGPWIGPIILVGLVGFTFFLIIVAIYSSKVILP